ncbi:hypothetical protein DFR54_105121 [Vagococcus fluvialis]|uniref:Uncharacterized protein n=2 Tax=Vagococcus fluvialis TaxID=2738 RepID=A0A369AX25_9ENTE|nr:hypothetical protein [Vagococcus fluvialis]RCX13711.1 hypothetical protein DFR54_105121 [Vagococcus fluvialis]RSU02292.1 hypothetical protein CBF32_06825 [Vagococcus fluvialis]WNF90765.1 hypothetical protein QDW48_03365 [Vagococcus fluvialis]
MEDNKFQIKSRIFKRERVRENRNNLVIVSKRKEEANKNQIELSFKNPSLEPSHLFIVGRVMVKEWERLLSQYPVTRSFIQIREEGQIRFYISFQVDNDLSSREIKSTISLVTEILEECLEKVLIKADKELPIQEADVVSNKSAEEITGNKMVSDNNELISQLHQEIEEQENLLKKLAVQQELLLEPIFEDVVEEKVTTEVVPEKTDKSTDNQKEEMIAVLSMQVTSLNKEIERLRAEAKESQKINLELDKANIKLNEIVQQNKVDETRLEKISEIEKKLRALKQENSEYRIQLNESQHMIEQYKNSNGHLNESLKRLETTHDEFIKNAQTEMTKLETELKEAEKKILIEVNGRQKLEIQLNDTQVKLGQEIRSSEKREDKIKQLNLDLSRQLKQREKATNEMSDLEELVDQLKADLKLSKVSNDILKDELNAYEEQKAKWQQIDVWQTKYEDLETKFNELQNESLSYRQEIHLLNSQLTSIEEQLEAPVTKEAKNQISYSLEKEVVKEPAKVNSLLNAPLSVVEKDDYDYFSYEEDPYVEEVITEELMNIRKKDQMKDEEEIKELLEYYYEEDFKDIKVDKDEYRKHILSFKFLSFRWSQVFIINEADKNAAFLEWCSDYIDKIESFEEELSFDVKKSFFAKNYVTMDESTYHILKGYSKLSTYLDTYYLKVSYYIDKYFLNEGNR